MWIIKILKGRHLSRHGQIKQRKRTRRIRKVSGKSKKDFQIYKTSALLLAHERLAHFNTHYNFKLGDIRIKNHVSRWGSCSSKGNINFNYRIALLPPHLADYIIVHELCHLGEFNHSIKFWNLVGQTLPDYESLRAELKRKGMSLY